MTTSSKAEAKAFSTEFSFCKAQHIISVNVGLGSRDTYCFSVISEMTQETCRKRLVTMPRMALLRMRTMTRGLAMEDSAELVKALERSPFAPRSKTLQTMESRYMNTFWIMMSMSAPFPLIKNSL